MFLRSILSLFIIPSITSEAAQVHRKLKGASGAAEAQTRPQLRRLPPKGGGDGPGPLAAPFTNNSFDGFDYGDELTLTYTISGDIPRKTKIHVTLFCTPVTPWDQDCTGNFNCNFFLQQTQCAHGQSYRDNDNDGVDEYRYCTADAKDDIAYVDGTYSSEVTFKLVGLRGNDYHWHDANKRGDGYGVATCFATIFAREETQGGNSFEDTVLDEEIFTVDEDITDDSCPCEAQDGGTCDGSSGVFINYGNAAYPNLSDTCYEQP